jgi:transposase-like protein
VSIYSAERKQAVLSKLLPPSNKSVASVAREEGVSQQTLYNWRKQAKNQGQPVPGNKSKPEQWSHETKFAVVVETSVLSESELSEYCRKKGLYPEQIKQWKHQCLQGFHSNEQQASVLKLQTKKDKSEIKLLKKDLRFKEKALAETAALLVLRKKLKAFYGEEPEDD